MATENLFSLEQLIFKIGSKMGVLTSVLTKNGKTVKENLQLIRF